MFKNHANEIRSGWLIVIAFILMFVGQTLFMVPGLTYLSTLETGAISGDLLSSFEEHPWAALWTQGAGTFGGFIVTLVVWKLMNKGSMRSLGFRDPMKDLLFGLFLGALSITLIFFILYGSGNLALSTTITFSSFTIIYLILFILVGFFEETFFRGYIMSTMLSRGNSKSVVYITSALLFSIVHGTNPNVTLLGLFNIMLVGLLFAYMFLKTDSLLLPIGYHITWNYFQGNVFGFAVSGTTPYGILTIDASMGNELLTGGEFGLEGGLLTTLLVLVGFFITHLYTKRRLKDKTSIFHSTTDSY